MSNLERYQQLLRRSLIRIRERTEEENGDDNDFVTGFANFRTQHDSRPGQTAAAGAYRRRTNPVYSFKIACLDGPEFTNVSPMMIRRLNKCGLGSRKIVISRSDSVINFKKRVIELFPKLERVDFEFFQAKLREKHRLEQVVFNSLKDLKAKVKFTLYIKPAQQLINITEGESDEEELPPLFPPRRERQSDDANLTAQASTSDTPDSPRSRQRNSTLSQPGTSGASTTVTSERSNSSSTQITSTLSSPGRNRATVALEGSNTPSSRRGRVIASPVARRSNESSS
ncbi:uncharacterized protein LOC127733720 [Mytilus californianus]|uniref:uncharacterized protein LOC127733720 n=1 Tax=Mytilus californianus TaxID=6549 RepID=UPI0022486182|nr:uncharacterized protein LOC127733720 [Mytilus californianus]